MSLGREIDVTVLTKRRGSNKKNLLRLDPRPEFLVDFVKQVHLELSTVLSMQDEKSAGRD
jgi:hypothetical protein